MEMCLSFATTTKQPLLLATVLAFSALGVAAQDSDTIDSLPPALAPIEIDTLGMAISEEEIEAIKLAIAYGPQISQAAEKVNGLPYRRDAHAKATGCVRARFTVNDDIDTRHRHSIFQQPGAEFQAWIRFSNGDMTLQADKKADARGMAVRVMNVPGEKIAPELPQSNIQDFVMTNYPVFFNRNVFDYVENMQHFAELDRTGWFIGLFPPRLHLKQLLIAKNTVASVINTPLQPQYFSMVPYQLGDTPLKFSAKPCAGMTFTEQVDQYDYSYLTKAMQAKLDTSEACFDFMVQEQKADKDMPIDDATVEWSEKDSPFIPIAKILIPPQRFTTLAQQEFCENLSMNPWHAVGRWVPLGSLNRSRRLVYYAVSRFRHAQNGAQPSSPSNWCINGESECDLRDVLQ